MGDGQDEYVVHTNHLYTGRCTQVGGSGDTGMFGNLDQLTSLLAEFPIETIIVDELQNGGQTYC